VNLLDTGTEWNAVSETKGVFEGRDRMTGEARWTGTRVDLVFGSNSQLRALAEVMAARTRRRSSTGTSLPRGRRW
jgi:catalase-peroxidase